MRAVLFTILAIMTSSLFAGHANAEGAGACSNYTERALKQAAKAQALKCLPDNQFGPRFSPDRNAHIRWCRGVKAESVRYEQQERDRFVSHCEGCKAYARDADRAARENVAFRCGFEGPRWGFGDASAMDGHYRWCMGRTLGSRDGDVAPENAARAAALKNCRAKIKDRFTEEERKPCRDYSRKAALHATQNVVHRCGAKQFLRWSANEREHFEACIFVGQAGKAFLAEEEEIRRKGVEACMDGWLLSDDGYNTNRKGKAPPTVIRGIEQKIRPAGGDNTSTNPSTSKSKGSSSASTSSGGCGGSAMDRLGGGGGCVPSGRASGGDNLSHSSGTPGTRSKLNMGGGTSSGGSGAIGGGPSGGVTSVGGAPVAAPKPEKRFGRSGNSSVDYGFGPKPPPPKPPYLR